MEVLFGSFKYRCKLSNEKDEKGMKVEDKTGIYDENPHLSQTSLTLKTLGGHAQQHVIPQKTETTFFFFLKSIEIKGQKNRVNSSS